MPRDRQPRTLTVIDVDPATNRWQTFRHIYAYDWRTRSILIIACEHREAADIEAALDTDTRIVIQPDDWQEVGITGRTR